MSHDIRQHDNLVLHKEGAWHGMGIVVEEAPTPREALTLAGLDWGVEQRPLFAKDPEGNEVWVPEYVANYRADTKTYLGLVSAKYKVISNAEMADFCEALQMTDEKVKVETAGSLWNGGRVWFLLKGESFEVANGDGIFPYNLVSNGHDGGSTFRVTPTTIRVVCRNTMSAVIPMADTGELGSSAISIRHTVNVMERLEEAKRALAGYSAAIEATKNLANDLAKRDVTREEVQQFFLDCYTYEYGEVPTNPKDATEERRKNRAMDAYNSFTRRFDDEREIAGASLWNAFNAFSGLVQHDKKARGKDDKDRIEKRVNSNLLGLNAERTGRALQRAFKMLVS